MGRWLDAAAMRDDTWDRGRHAVSPTECAQYRWEVVGIVEM